MNSSSIVARAGLTENHKDSKGGKPPNPRATLSSVGEVTAFFKTTTLCAAEGVPQPTWATGKRLIWDGLGD